MIYIFAPCNAASGGPELLQQLCMKIRNLGGAASMVYYYSYFIVKPNQQVSDRYASYENPISDKILDSPENTIVVPEVGTHLLRRYHKVKKVIWWLSVDNYYKKKKEWSYRINTGFGLFAPILTDCHVMHLYQSYYAREHLRKLSIQPECQMELSDYLNHAFIENAYKEQSQIKQNRVLYNPKKGFEYTQQLMIAMVDLEWQPLQGMTPDQMSHVMQTSKLYIDFGEHPGKDRIPREAAISGCCILTGKRGAAKNEFDIPVPSQYKIDQGVMPLADVEKKIRFILNNYESCRQDFDTYRNKIRHEEEKFEHDTQRFLDWATT
ncbi:hypothetical protein [uncultured Gemmiger sp.]|uniref:hypothetical protein n=1 Tax=uncultured Gemmiger sp. TaxID=1623490 RepID=UPI0025FB3FA2|nr:hypothetical protein [uncultured Gemmiger sp.]